MSLEIKGVLEKFLPVQSGEKKDGSGTWSKQSFLVRTTEEYNNLYCLEVFGDDKVANLTKFQKVGDDIKVIFNVNTSEWQGRYFTSLSVYRIEPANSGTALDNMPSKTSGATSQSTEDEPDDLPF
jgi:hypothetical protein